MDLNYLFHKLFKIAFFFVIVYTLLTQSLKSEDYMQVLRLVLIITLLFIVIDCYYPTIFYE